MSFDTLIRTDNIIRISPNETLSSALAKLSSSHDAAFVFSDDNKFLGVINPYYCLIKSSYPGNAKVEHCVYHPPKLHFNYPLAKVADSFIQSKIHYLPVFDDKERFKGIISARYLISAFQLHPIFHVPIQTILKEKKKPIATVDENDSIASAINEFKKTKLSKLIVVTKDLKLKGILTYYDLITYLINPKDHPGQGQREGLKTNALHQKVKNFAKSFVFTVSPQNSLSDVVKFILTKSIGSVIVVDQNKRPIGIITTKDILRYFISQHKQKRIEIINKNLSEKSKNMLNFFYKPFAHLIRRSPNLNKAKILVEEEKQGGLFKIVLSLFPKKGKPQVIHKEGKNLLHLLPSLNGILRRITRRE